MAAAQLTVYKQQLAEELRQYCAQQRQVVQASYGDRSLAAAELLFDETLHGSHYPGLLVMIGYALEQGGDDQVALTAARAVELLAAAARLFDGGQTIAGQFGYGQAMTTLANLPGTAEADRIKALSITSHSTVLRAHGVANNQSEGQFALWRDAHFHWLNPMHIGMVLAGADCHSTLR